MFNLSLPPQDLWSSVLGDVRPGEAVELLKVNKRLRSLILHQGPFLKRVDRLQIGLDETYPEEEDYQKRPERTIQIAFHLIYEIVDPESITVNDDSFPFSLLTSNHYMWNNYGTHLPYENGWLLVRLIRSCRLLEIQNSTHCWSTAPEWEKFFDRWQFLPQIRVIADLALITRDTELMHADHLLVVLERLEPHVTTSIRFQIYDPHPDETRIRLEKLSKRPNFGQIKSLQAKRFRTFQEEIPLDDYWRLFSGNQTADTVIFTHDSFDRFQETLDRFLKDGLPRGPKITSAALIVSIWLRDLDREPNIEYFEDMMKKVDDFRPYNLENHSSQAKLMEETLRSKWRKDPELFDFFRSGSSEYENSGWLPLIVPRSYDQKRFFELRGHGLFGMCTCERTVNKDKTIYENLQVWFQIQSL